MAKREKKESIFLENFLGKELGSSLTNQENIKKIVKVVLSRQVIHIPYLSLTTLLLGRERTQKFSFSFGMEQWSHF